MTTQNRVKTVLTLVAVAMAVFAGSAQALECQLGLLDLTKDYGAGAGNNPATGNPWAPGDPYHLIYVTSTLRDATSSDIAVYNAFVQADADAEGIGGVTWYVLGSTATVNAKDNAVITGPVFGIYDSKYVAVDATDLWDYIFPAASLILQLDGEGKNAHTGTTTGGLSHPSRPLGNAGNVEFEWTAWQNWAGANKNGPATDLREMVALSEPLVIVSGDPNLPDVDAGPDMISWSGAMVALDPNVVNNDTNEPQGTLTYAWTAEPNGIGDPNLDVAITGADTENASVTITKTATGDVTVVTMTLAVTLEGKEPVTDSMTIDVYDDSCLAAIALGMEAFDITDLDQDCITNFTDFALMAATWLDDYALTGPVVK
jgi:hypothetical protein